MIENYQKLRKGKQYNKTTGDFCCSIIKRNHQSFDTSYLLSIICKCGSKYYKEYSIMVQNLMLQYIQKSEYGTAVFFAELIYDKIIKKKKQN